MSKKSQSKKTDVKRIDVKVRKSVPDIKKEPKNNNEVGKMSQRYYYEKTGNWVVYARMLQLKRRPENTVEDNVIKTVGVDVD